MNLDDIKAELLASVQSVECCVCGTVFVASSAWLAYLKERQRDGKEYALFVCPKCNSLTSVAV